MSPLVPPYPLIRKRLQEGRVIPVLGSGASLGSRTRDVVEDGEENAGAPTLLPTASALADQLADMAEFPSDEPRDLTKVAQYFSVVGGRDDLNQALHDIFAREYQYTALHSYLADLPVPLLIVTTNYDDLIEQALKAKGRAYDVVVHTTDASWGECVLWWQHGALMPVDQPPNELDIDLRSRTVVYKIHGAVDRLQPSRGQFVITEDDYIDFLARMTRNKAVPAIFAEPFQKLPFLFLGYGLRDWNLRVVLSRIERALPRLTATKSWAIQRGPSLLEQRLWQERGVELYSMTLEAFIAGLMSGSGL